ncbi:MAG: dehydrogenase [Planctomycetaceae bacterium]|nr:dehydrogenase [Planctomycetaceae bacterium]
MAADACFRVGLTRDFLNADGKLAYGDIGIGALESRQDVSVEFLPDYGDELPGHVGRDFDALLVLAPRVTAVTLSDCNRLAIVARFGVGYDNVDVEACTAANVLLTITPDGVRRPVAVSALTMLLALSHQLLAKDRLTRDGRWHEKLDYMGVGLTGRTLGLIGFGNIGQEIAKVVAPLEMRLATYDPFTSAENTAALGVERMELDELLQESTYVCVCCALTSDTRHLLDARRLALLKPSAFLINVSRGPVVDQAALTEVLAERRIAGAALDVFEQEPIDHNDPLLKLDNVILSPHAICWTDELFRGNGEAACRSILEVASGRFPKDVVNRQVVEHAGMKQKLERYSAGN